MVGSRRYFEALGSENPSSSRSRGSYASDRMPIRHNTARLPIPLNQAFILTLTIPQRNPRHRACRSSRPFGAFLARRLDQLFLTDRRNRARRRRSLLSHSAPSRRVGTLEPPPLDSLRSCSHSLLPPTFAPFSSPRATQNNDERRSPCFLPRH